MRVLTPIIDLVENNRTAASVGLAGILRHPCCIKALGQGIEPCCEELLHASKLSGICGQLRPTRQPGRAVRVRLPTVVRLRVINPKTLTPLYSREEKFMKSFGDREPNHRNRASLFIERTASAQELRSGKSERGTRERWLRMCVGVLCMVCSLFFLNGTLPGYLVAISGCITFLTCLVQWSPLWAMPARTVQE